MAKKPPSRGEISRRKLPPVPNSRAVLICEKIIKDWLTGTVTVVGVLTRFNMIEYPGFTPGFFLFAQLTGGVGQYDMTYEVQDEGDGVVMGRSPPMPLIFESKTEVRDIIIQIPPVPLNHSGVYTVALFVNGNEVGHQTFDTPDDGSKDADKS